MPSIVNPAHGDQVDGWIEDLGKEEFLAIVEQIHQSVLNPNEQLSNLLSKIKSPLIANGNI